MQAINIYHRLSRIHRNCGLEVFSNVTAKMPSDLPVAELRLSEMGRCQQSSIAYMRLRGYPTVISVGAQCFFQLVTKKSLYKGYDG